MQYRNKSSSTKQKEWEALNLVSLCKPLSIPLIINDDIKLAKRVNAAGVHLGGDDAPIIAARDELGKDAIIGASCYNSLQLAINAQNEGASYVAFGRFFPSVTKPDAVTSNIDLLKAAKKELTIPVIAIGGINAKNGKELVAAGADMLAVVEGIFSQSDITLATKQLEELYR